MTTNNNIVFNFDVASETLNGIVSLGRLELDIRNEISLLVGLLDVSEINGSLIFNFKSALSANEVTVLVLLVSLHDGVPLSNERFSTFHPKHITLDNRLKISQTPDIHGPTHESGGADEISVHDLAGVLTEQQHIIPSEAITAMGLKSNSNSFNHDRFQQSEIINLPEVQLNLNFPTHSNANDPNTSEKQAMGSSDNPNTSNPFLTKSGGDITYSNLSHSHVNLPTNDQKAALDAANSPSALNKFLTINDLPDTDHAIEINATALLIRTLDPIGYIVKVLDDETISSILYQSGWYSYLGAGNGSGFDSTDWQFHSANEAHTHNWSDVSKAGSKLSDIGDIPPYPVNGNEYILITTNGVNSWVLKSSVFSSSKRVFTVNLMKEGSASRDWLELSEHIDSDESTFTPLFDCKVREITFTSKQSISSNSQVCRISAKYRSISTSDMSTSDPDEWVVNSNGANVIYNVGNSQKWGYDVTSENRIMLRNRQYGFLISRPSGSKKWKDVFIQILLEEL